MTKLAQREVEQAKEVLPYVEATQKQELGMWPNVLLPLKRNLDFDDLPEEGDVEERQSFHNGPGRAIRKLMQTYLRMQDTARIIRLGMSDPEGDGRGWAAVSLTKLNKFEEAARLAAGPDGNTPCGYQTLRYVAHALAKVGAVEAAFHLSKLQRRCGRTKYITSGSREVQSILESSALYLQSTSEQTPKFLAGHGARVSIEVEAILKRKGEILALTPHRRYRMLTEAFNQLIRWYGRARLIPQALRACEIMNELGIPRNDMTIHFLSRGAAQQFTLFKQVERYSQMNIVGDWPGRRPEVAFIGRTNSGKSSMINSLFSSLTKFAPASKTRAWTRKLHFYEVNRERAGLPHFMLVDTPGLGYAGIEKAAQITREWPNLIYDYLRNRESLRHVFHLCDARNKRLLPADKQLLHLLATAQRRDVKYTIIVTKIDVCNRRLVNETAKNIREELEPYLDVDIMFASARSLRGVDHLWSKIWQTVTETPRGKRHKDIGPKELERLRKMGAKAASKDKSLAQLLNIPEVARPPQDFDADEWAEDSEFERSAPGKGSQEYFNDRWGEDLDEDEPLSRDSKVSDLGGFDFEGTDEEDFDDAEDAEFALQYEAKMAAEGRGKNDDKDGRFAEDFPEFDDESLEQRWEEFEEDEDEEEKKEAS